MTETLDLFGQAAPPGQVAAVPAVILHSSERRQRIVGEALPCAHCAMNRDLWSRRPARIPQWRTKADIQILHGVVRITKVDGSTLILCGQHDREHAGRAGRDG